MQHMPLSMRTGCALPGPKRFGPGFLASLLLGMLVYTASIAVADDHKETVWESWQAPVLEAWENWREQRFLEPDPTASFEPVVGAYNQAVEVFSNQPLSAIETDGLRAHLTVLNALAFHLFPLQPNEHSGFSVNQAYQQALLIWKELLRRDHATSADAELLMHIALGTRNFDTAVEINDTASLGFSIPAGVADSDRTLGDAARKVWLLDDDDYVEAHSFEFPDNLHWVVLSIEGCGFFQRFLSDTDRLDPLADLLADRVSWLLPPSPHFDMSFVERARSTQLSIHPVFMDNAGEWPMFEDMTRSPIIQLMRGEQVLESWVAWPEDGGHFLEMSVAWEKHQRPVAEPY